MSAAAVAPSGYITVSLTWISVLDEFPDADQTVLVSLRDAPGSEDSDPTWIGFTDGKDWYDAATGSEFVGSVSHWAVLPMQVQP